MGKKVDQAKAEKISPAVSTAPAPSNQPESIVSDKIEKPADRSQPPEENHKGHMIKELQEKMLDLSLSLCEDAKAHRTMQPEELKRIDTIVSLYEALTLKA